MICNLDNSQSLFKIALWVLGMFISFTAVALQLIIAPNFDAKCLAVMYLSNENDIVKITNSNSIPDVNGTWNIVKTINPTTFTINKIANIFGSIVMDLDALTFQNML